MVRGGGGGRGGGRKRERESKSGRWLSIFLLAHARLLAVYFLAALLLEIARLSPSVAEKRDAPRRSSVPERERERKRKDLFSPSPMNAAALLFLNPPCFIRLEWPPKLLSKLARRHPCLATRPQDHGEPVSVLGEGRLCRTKQRSSDKRNPSLCNLRVAAAVLLSFSVLSLSFSLPVSLTRTSTCSVFLFSDASAIARKAFTCGHSMTRGRRAGEEDEAEEEQPVKEPDARRCLAPFPAASRCRCCCCCCCCCRSSSPLGEGAAISAAVVGRPLLRPERRLQSIASSFASFLFFSFFQKTFFLRVCERGVERKEGSREHKLFVFFKSVKNQ